ncbi:transposase [Acetobacter okinawensis]|uniref:transposase n=1 Tax=Acetobacter okinawensis TaxID=1076594 RepID=UPI0018FFC212
MTQREGVDSRLPFEAGLGRGDLSEAEWRVLKGLLPIEAANRGRGCRPEHNRSIINGILWRLRCGTPWRDVPPKYGNWNTIYRRFRRWSEAGVREVVAVTLAEIMADSGHYSIDSTTIRAHVSAAGGKEGLIDELLAARGAGSPVSFTAWLMPGDDHSPST